MRQVHISPGLSCVEVCWKQSFWAQPKITRESSDDHKLARNPRTKLSPFQEWSLSQLIDVACDIGILEPDIKKFSHGLRDFRNYIHPYEELISNFTPDIHTARVCYQVLRAALASVSGQR